MERGGEMISVLIYLGEERDRIYSDIFVGVHGLGFDGSRWWSDGLDLYGGYTHVLTE